MKVSKLANDLVRFSLTTKELSKMNINIDPANLEECQDILMPFLMDLIQRATDQYDLDFNDGEVHIASCLHDDMLEFYVSAKEKTLEEIEACVSKNDKKTNISPSESAKEIKASDDKEEPCRNGSSATSACIELKTLHDVIFLSKICLMNDIRSSLYKDHKNSRYVLLISSCNRVALGAFSLKLEEFGYNKLRIVKHPERLDECMEIIIKDNALTELRAL